MLEHLGGVGREQRYLAALESLGVQRSAFPVGPYQQRRCARESDQPSIPGDPVQAMTRTLAIERTSVAAREIPESKRPTVIDAHSVRTIAGKLEQKRKR